MVPLDKELDPGVDKPLNARSVCSMLELEPLRERASIEAACGGL